MAKFDYKKWVTENKYGKINEQFTGYNEQNMAPLTGTCPAASLTINNPEELANLIGFDPNTGPEGFPYSDQPQYISMAVQAAVSQQINDGDTIKVHASVWPYLSSIPVQQYNPFDGYGWAYTQLSAGVAMEPQIPDGYLNSDAAADYNPEYIFMNTNMGLEISGQFRWCQYSQEDAYCLQYGYGHTGYCPASAASGPSTDPGVAPTTPTGMVTGMPGKPTNVSPVKPEKPTNVSPARMAPRPNVTRRALREMIIKEINKIKKRK